MASMIELWCSQAIVISSFALGNLSRANTVALGDTKGSDCTRSMVVLNMGLFARLTKTEWNDSFKSR